MDKREALGIYMKLHDECLKHEECEDCPFYEQFVDNKICSLLLTNSNMLAALIRKKLESMGEKQEEHSVPPKNVKATTTLYAKVPKSAEEFEKQLKALLPNRLTLEPLPKEDRPIKMPESSKPDNVNHPKHYLKGGLECIQVIKAQLTSQQYEGYLYGNVLKYMWRWPDKNGLEDLRKAAKYLEWLQEEVKHEQGLDRK